MDSHTDSVKKYLDKYSADKLKQKLKKNERKVQYLRTKLLYEIYSNDGLTRSEIAEVLDFTIPQVSLFLSHLFDIGIIKVYEDIDKKNKRKIKKVKLNSDNFILMGIKIDPGKIESVVTNSNRKLIDHSIVHFPLSNKKGYKKTQEIILHHIFNTISEFTSKYKNICGIGIASAGIVNYQNQSIVAFPEIYDWNEFFLRKEIENKFSLPIILTGQGSSKTRFYSYLDEIKSNKDFIYISVDDTLSMGIYYSKHIYRNNISEEPNIEHYTVDPDGKLCYCGKRGCLNIFSSFQSMKNTILKEVENGTESALSNYSYYFTFTDLLKEANKGDKLANQVLDISIKNLGFAIGNIINLFTPKKILIGGYFSEYIELYKKIISKQINKYLSPFIRDTIEIKFIDEDKFSAPIGAALAVLEEIFDFNYYINLRLL